MKENISCIIGEQVSNIDIEQMKAVLDSEAYVDSVDNFTVIKYGPYFQITGEISMNSSLTLQEVHDVVELLEKNLKKMDHRAMYINIHVNPSQKEEIGWKFYK